MSTRESAQQSQSAPSTLMTRRAIAKGPYRSATLSVDDCALHCVAGPHQGLVHQLDQDRCLIGRADWCELSLPEDQRISRHHCEVLLRDDGVRVRDLGSRNGTSINGIQINDAFLGAKARLQVGDSIFELQPSQDKVELQVNYHDDSGHLVGKSEPMRQIFSLLSRLGPWDVPVLLQGETGTGKSSVARALHELSQRAHKPLITVNCGALPASLIESMFFGHEKGAFTGAEQRHIGYFEQAEGGTLFLDEIGELPLELQPKLLDVLERHCIRRLGGDREVEVDFRLITATHRDLTKAVADKVFREDLYYRLEVIKCEVPPLRERLEDIPLLADYILSSVSPDEDVSLTPAAVSRLQQHLWPGNVRELENVIKRSLVFLARPEIDVDDLEPSMAQAANRQAMHASQGQHPASVAHGSDPLAGFPSLQDKLEAEEKATIEAAIAYFDGDAKRVIKYLGLSRTAYYNRLQKYAIKRQG